MNNKKIVVFSTRKIQDEGIFKSFQRFKDGNSILAYFPDIKNFKEERAGSEKNDSNERYYAWKKEFLKERINSFTKDEQKFIKRPQLPPIAFLKYVIEHYVENDSFFSEAQGFLTALEAEIASKKSDNTAGLDLDMPYEGNIDAEGKTVADRISLFGFPDVNEDGYAVYAVWPLKQACDNESWENVLSEAVFELNPDCEEIILWLHDNDMEGTRGSTFHVLYYQKKVNVKDKTIKRSLGVFQHPDPEFNDVLFSPYDACNEANLVFDKVDTLFGKITKMQNHNNNNKIAEDDESLTPGVGKKKWDEQEIDK